VRSGLGYDQGVGIWLLGRNDTRRLGLAFRTLNLGFPSAAGLWLLGDMAGHNGTAEREISFGHEI
jgi:hypothetical protein